MQVINALIEQSFEYTAKFAKGILSEMKHISNFSDNTKEITKALGVLNDYAVKLYQQYSNRLKRRCEFYLQNCRENVRQIQNMQKS